MWFYLAVTADATTFMLMKHDCVGDENGWRAFTRKISECEDADSFDFGGLACSTAAQSF